MRAIQTRQDWVLNGAVGVLMVSGLLMIYSAARGLFPQQLISVVIGAGLIFLFSRIDWRALAAYRWIIFLVYLAALVLLVATYFFAPVIRNTRSWLVIGPVQFQVSELMKVALIIFYAYFFTRQHIGIAQLGNIIKSFIYFLLPAIFIFLQPDMGTMMVLLGIWVGFLLVSGLKGKHIMIGFCIALLLLGVAWFGVLKDYQKERIIGFFQPNYDPLGINYSTIQSKIAIGSGGWFGKGFGQGTQVQLGFLPEASTDFIYAAFIEEWGLVGGLAILGVFLLLLFRIVRIGMYAESNFYRFVCLGTAVMFLIQFIINVGSAIGFLPVIGLTFPFFSYGGSSLLVNSLLVGIVQSSAVYQKM